MVNKILDSQIQSQDSMLKMCEAIESLQVVVRDLIKEHKILKKELTSLKRDVDKLIENNR